MLGRKASAVGERHETVGHHKLSLHMLCVRQADGNLDHLYVKVKVSLKSESKGKSDSCKMFTTHA